MSEDEIRTVVRATLQTMEMIANRTRSHVDNMMVQMLKGNEDRLVEVITKAWAASGDAAPSNDQIAAALLEVGIRI